MVMRHYRLLLPLMMAVCVLSTQLHADTIKLQNFISDDNNDVSQNRHILGYIKSVPGSFDKLDIGIHGGYWSFNESNTRKEFSIIGVSGDVDFGTMGMLSSEIMNYSNKAWSTETFNLSYRQPTLKPYYLEASLERSIVDTLLAINDKIMVDTYSLSADAPVANEFTLVGAATYQNFTDNNTKTGGLIKLVYTPARIKGFNTALVFKQIQSEQTSTGYFSPDKQQLIYLDASYATGILNDKFVFKSSLALGKEVINDSTYNNLLKVELGLRGWINDTNGLEARLGWSNTGDTIATRSASNYLYRYAILNYSHALD
jgi:hypothetical protein